MMPQVLVAPLAVVVPVTEMVTELFAGTERPAQLSVPPPTLQLPVADVVVAVDDQVTPAEHIKLHVTMPFPDARNIRIESADSETSKQLAEVTIAQELTSATATFTVPRLQVSALVIVEK